MNTSFLSKILLSSILFFLLTGCKPIADAGADQTVEYHTQVQLDGSASTYIANFPLSNFSGTNYAATHPLIYQWTMSHKPNGSNATLSDASLVNPTFVADNNGLYTFELMVNNGEENSTIDTVTITASVINQYTLNICDQWSVSNSGGEQGTADDWDISQIPVGAFFDFKFEAYRIPDKFRVEYEGVNKLNTGWRGNYAPNNEVLEGPGRFDKYGLFIKGNSDTMRVAVTGGQSGTGWNYMVRCINPDSLNQGE